MPHRIVTQNCGTLLEALLLGIASVYQITSSAVVALTEQDWTRLMGPQGFTVGLLLAVVVLWGNGVCNRKAELKRREQEEKAREKRHVETIGLQRDNSEKITRVILMSIYQPCTDSMSLLEVYIT